LPHSGADLATELNSLHNVCSFILGKAIKKLKISYSGYSCSSQVCTNMGGGYFSGAGFDYQRASDPWLSHKLYGRLFVFLW